MSQSTAKAPDVEAYSEISSINEGPIIAYDGKPIGDEDALAALGYKQEFKREFGLWTTFGVSFSVMGLLPSSAAVLLFGLSYGGTGGQSIVSGVLRRHQLILTPSCLQGWPGDGS